MKKRRPNTPAEKFRNSAINVVFSGAISLLAFIVINEWHVFRIVWLVVFFFHQALAICFFDGRTLGHILTKTYHAQRYDMWQYWIWSILYTVSFSTVVFGIMFPGDLFLVNMVLQFICIKCLGTTIHQYFAGGMKTVQEE
jgi:hypothetical protein